MQQAFHLQFFARVEHGGEEFLLSVAHTLYSRKLSAHALLACPLKNHLLHTAGYFGIGLHREAVELRVAGLVEVGCGVSTFAVAVNLCPFNGILSRREIDIFKMGEPSCRDNRLLVVCLVVGLRHATHSGH